MPRIGSQGKAEIAAGFLVLREHLLLVSLWYAEGMSKCVCAHAHTRECILASLLKKVIHVQTQSFM